MEVCCSRKVARNRVAKEKSLGAAVSILWSPVILAPYAPPLFLNFSSQPANDLRKFNSKLRTESTFSRYSNCTRAKFKESLWPRRFKVTFNEKYKGSWKTDIRARFHVWFPVLSGERRGRNRETKGTFPFLRSSKLLVSHDKLISGST